MRKFWIFLFILIQPLLVHCQVKVLHLTFHRGCAKEFEAVAKALSLDVTTWYIHDLPPKFFDGQTQGSALYNIGHARAERIWNLHKEYFQTFDTVFISDTAPLSRIFLQNGWNKPLVIWICNRFDYSDLASLDCDFPDQEYYRMFAEACKKKNVTMVAYTPYEHHYAHTKGIDTGSLTIKPTGTFLEEISSSPIPSDILKEKTFFFPPYHNETIFMDAAAFCNKLGIKSYCGRYNGSKDLEAFRGIIHLPYAWSNLALFENLQLGIPYFIPSAKFLKKLISLGNYFDSNMSYKDLFYLSEWYSPENAPLFIYFDSWKDLQRKIEKTDFSARREQLKIYARQHTELTLEKWRSVFFRNK